MRARPPKKWLSTNLDMSVMQKIAVQVISVHWVVVTRGAIETESICLKRNSAGKVGNKFFIVSFSLIKRL
jgi:hypothetical protein